VSALTKKISPPGFGSVTNSVLRIVKTIIPVHASISRAARDIRALYESCQIKQCLGNARSKTSTEKLDRKLTPKTHPENSPMIARSSLGRMAASQRLMKSPLCLAHKVSLDTRLLSCARNHSIASTGHSVTILLDSQRFPAHRRTTEFRVGTNFGSSQDNRYSSYAVLSLRDLILVYSLLQSPWTPASCRSSSCRRVQPLSCSSLVRFHVFRNQYEVQVVRRYGNQ